jgi:phage replication-related protein YjqB (UPF0714/DUF867 family)
MEIARNETRLILNPMAHGSAYFSRREFMVALGASGPLLLLSCEDIDSQQLRADDPSAWVTPPPGGLHTEVKVERALSSQSFKSDDRMCSVPDSLPVEVGDQVRVTRKSNQVAIYTIVQKREQDDPDDVRMGLEGRLRLGTSNEFHAMLSVPVVAEGLTDEEAEAADEFVERLVDDGSNTGLVVLAPHGGQIEFNTDRQAELVTSVLGCSSWICKGWKADGGAYSCWHVTSKSISPRSFPGLGLIANRGFTYAVSFHGMTHGGVLIGGRAPLEIRKMIRNAIRDALSDDSISVQIASNLYEGDSPDNVVNWLTLGGGGGVQIEQSPKVRLEHWQEVATAVIGVFALFMKPSCSEPPSGLAVQSSPP